MGSAGYIQNKEEPDWARPCVNGLASKEPPRESLRLSDRQIMKAPPTSSTPSRPPVRALCSLLDGVWGILQGTSERGIPPALAFSLRSATMEVPRAVSGRYLRSALGAQALERSRGRPKKMQPSYSSIATNQLSRWATRIMKRF